MAEEINKSNKGNKNALVFISTRVDDEKPLLLLIHEKRVEYIIYNELLKTFAANYDCGYYLNWDKNAIAMLKHRVFCTMDEITKAIAYLLEEDYFDEGVFDKYKILTNKDAQTNWMIAARRRANFLSGIVKEIMVIDYADHIEYFETKTMRKMNGLIQNVNKKSAESNEEIIEFYEKLPNTDDKITEYGTEQRNESISCIETNNSASIAKHSIAKRSEAKEFFSDSTNQNASKEVVLESMPVLEIENKVLREMNHNEAISNFELEVSKPQVKPQKTKSGENSQKMAVTKKPVKLPHPARAEFIKIWEAETGLLYVSELELNTSMSNILKKFEGFVRGKIERNEIAENNKPIEFHMAEIYRKMWQNYKQLNDWQGSKFITWVYFNKNFDDLALAFNKIWTTDKPKIVKLETQHPSFQKMKFN